MYPAVYDTVHICTQSYTTRYIYVRSRIRHSTYMYAVVYDTVHICTQSYTTQYIYVPCRVRPCVYFFTHLITDSFRDLIDRPARCDRTAVGTVLSVAGPWTISVPCLGIVSVPVRTSRDRTMDGTNGQISPPAGCRTIRTAAPKGTLS